MKIKSKALLLMTCAALFVVATVFGTLAYLTDTESVENTFTVGKVGLTLDEAEVNPDGTVIPFADRVQENEYHLLPGHEYVKDPTIHVAADSEDCYLFVEVVNDIEDIEDEESTIDAQMKAKGWVAVGDYAEVYVLTENGKPVAVSADEDVVVFKSFKISGTVDNGTLEDYAESSVNVTAYAVQKDGFENATAEEIWEAAFPGA